MRIALIQPDSPYLMTPTAFPSLGLLYISSYLKMVGYNPTIYDLTGGRLLPTVKADVFGFSCQITQFTQVVQLKRILKAANPNAKFIIGGPFPTHSPKVCEKEGFTVVQGEGEIKMIGAMTGLPMLEKPINPNFFPDWEAIDLSRYGYLLEGKRCVNLMTKRGNCPYHCTFCAKSEIGTSKLRFRTAQNVLEEAKYLRDVHHFGAIAIYDDDVLLQKKRDYEIFQGLKDLGMPYRCMTRTNLATIEDLQMLKDTGCAELAIGVESADPFIHETICKKGTTVTQDTTFVRACKAIGLRVKTYLIIGLPGESHETIERTARWIETEKPDNYDVSIFTPYPGSDIYDNHHLYDIYWDEDNLKRIWYSGEAQYGECAVSTSHLTAGDILLHKREMDKKRGKGGATDYWRPMD